MCERNLSQCGLGVDDCVAALGALRLNRRKADGQAATGSGAHECRRITSKARVDYVKVDIEPVGLVRCRCDESDGLVVPVRERPAYDRVNVERTRGK